ncbi:MAG: excinuclease ABC subunit UvrB [Candidatus Margulisiibacteriota bacterium]
MPFQLVSDYKPAGDQPKAIEALVDRLQTGKKDTVLLGVTGSGKTFTLANAIAKLNRPALVLAHNKTLAAQLCAEFREFFPHNAVDYFISYYDYYQPEAYIASRDVYIEKEADINVEIERLRHSATRSLLTRRDVIIVASVSCIYGLGMPEDYLKGIIKLKVGELVKRRDFLLRLDAVQYERNDVELQRGRYRIKGNTIDVFPSWEENVLRLEFFGDELERMALIHPVSGTVVAEMQAFDIFPATHYVVHHDLNTSIASIEAELTHRLKELRDNGKVFEAHRLEQRTKYDIEMMREIGYCKGIENYSRHISGRPAGEAPGVLLDFFPKDFVTFIDESHASIPQVRGMYGGDQSRKQALVDYGFRLPSAKDNRPLQFDEFEKKVGQVVYVSATPGPYETQAVAQDPTGTIELIIRPTGLVDPEITVRPSLHQMDDLMGEIHQRIDRKERTLITTLTKKMSEDVSQFLSDQKIKVCYLHSEVLSLDRIDILHDLRAGKYDVLVGVNLLREGLDLPEVSLVAILDADKEGFLRNERSLIQTMGRAARNLNGKVILYADKMTDSMQKAIDETNRRRGIQLAYNQEHGVVPTSIHKKLADIRSEDRELLKTIEKEKQTLSPKTLPTLIAKLEKDMRQAAKNLEFELAAVLRDQIENLKALP